MRNSELLRHYQYKQYLAISGKRGFMKAHFEPSRPGLVFCDLMQIFCGKISKVIMKRRQAVTLAVFNAISDSVTDHYNS